MLDSGIRSRIRSLSTTIDNVMHPDIEHTMPAPVQQAVHTNTEQSLLSLRTITNAAHAATRILRQGTGHKMSMSQARAPHISISPPSDMAASPSVLAFPTQPQHVLGHLLGEVRDLEYSHQGLILAVAR